MMTESEAKAYEAGYMDMAQDVASFADGIKHGMFATADSMHEAIKYAYSSIETLPPEQRVGAYTVLHVMLNTVAQELRRLTKLEAEGEEE